MKFVLFLSLFAYSTAIMAQPQQFMSVKERLRILLWTEGLNEPKLAKKEAYKPEKLPEELERPLQKI